MRTKDIFISKSFGFDVIRWFYDKFVIWDTDYFAYQFFKQYFHCSVIFLFMSGGVSMILHFCYNKLDGSTSNGLQLKVKYIMVWNLIYDFLWDKKGIDNRFQFFKHNYKFYLGFHQLDCIWHHVDCMLSNSSSLFFAGNVFIEI